MGKDDLFKKKRAQREQRKFETRNPNINSYLIVTEGERTEPLYFAGLKELIQNKYGGTIKVVEIKIEGKGCGTNKLIEKTDEIVSRSKTMFQNVWIVFDKDDFIDFDAAVSNGLRKGYNIAWSNQSFEYWLYLHFEYSDSALHRDDWCKKLDVLFKKYDIGNEYHKNCKDLYILLNSFDGVETAIKNAKRRMAGFVADKHKPSEYNPGTTVYHLVANLKKYLDD